MNDQPKKPYMTPEVTQVPLRPEEAVLAACKVHSVNGAIGTGCGVVVPCSDQVS